MRKCRTTINVLTVLEGELEELHRVEEGRRRHRGWPLRLPLALGAACGGPGRQVGR
jgi:hypothetical protein